MKTTPIKISYLNEIQSVKEINADTFLLLTYNNDTLKGNVKIKSSNLLSDVENSLSYASNESYGLVKTSSDGGLINDNGVLSVDVSYIIDNIRNNPDSYASSNDDRPGLVSIQTGNGLGIDENGHVYTTYASDTKDIDNLSYGVVRAYIDSLGNTHGVIINSGVMSIDAEYILSQIKQSPNSYAGENASVAGLIKVGNNIDYDPSTGVISLTYASDTKAGLVMVGTENSGIINDNGKLSLDQSYITNTIFTDGAYAGVGKLGLVQTAYDSPISISDDGTLGLKIGDNINIDEDGTISLSYASKENHGIVKIGKGLEVDNGVVRCDAIFDDSITNKINGANRFYGDNASISIHLEAGGCYAWNKSVQISQYKISNVIINDSTIDGDIALSDTGVGKLDITRQYTNVTSKITVKLLKYDVEGQTNNVSVSASITPYNKIYWGNVDKATTSFTDLSYVTSLSKSNGSVVTSPSGLGTIDLTTELDKYLWICIPSGMNKTSITVTNVTKEPYTSIIMRKTYDTVGTLNGENYYCFRVNDYWTDASTIKFKIS